MTLRGHIAISGGLGSGKSSVARLLAGSEGAEVVSTGQIQRAVATSMGMSTLDMNRLAETDPEIDAKIDGRLVELSENTEPIIFDSRMAWHFVPSAFKIHLLVDATVAAERLFRARSSAVESYASTEDAERGADERFASERRRFVTKYGVDVARLRNYDLVVDASDAPAEEIAGTVKSIVDSAATAPSLLVSPRRVLPLGSGDGELTVAYAYPFLFAVHGLDSLGAALRAGRALLPASLAGEGDEPVDGLAANEHLRGTAAQENIDRWEATHGFHFSRRPELLPR